uniref:Uncharacterized protein n=1 Tax=Acrobeloides nanus TaxID=290746 RepID=A0A914D1Q2_9BILA
MVNVYDENSFNIDSIKVWTSSCKDQPKSLVDQKVKLIEPIQGNSGINFTFSIATILVSICGIFVNGFQICSNSDFKFILYSINAMLATVILFISILLACAGHFCPKEGEKQKNQMKVEQVLVQPCLNVIKKPTSSLYKEKGIPRDSQCFSCTV